MILLADQEIKQNLESSYEYKIIRGVRKFLPRIRQDMICSHYYDVLKVNFEVEISNYPYTVYFRIPTDINYNRFKTIEENERVWIDIIFKKILIKMENDPEYYGFERITNMKVEHGYDEY